MAIRSIVRTCEIGSILPRLKDEADRTSKEADHCLQSSLTSSCDIKTLHIPTMYLGLYPTVPPVLYVNCRESIRIGFKAEADKDQMPHVVYKQQR